MEFAVLGTEYRKIYRQRNILVIALIFCMLSNLFLSLKIFSQATQTIIMPGIQSEFSITSSKVSAGYLEEMSHMFLSYLLNLSPGNIAHKKNNIAKYVVTESYNDIAEYFDRQIDTMRKLKISSYFTPTEITLDEKNLTTEVKGILVSRFGKNGTEEKNIVCNLSFNYSFGLLRLKAFTVRGAG